MVNVSFLRLFRTKYLEKTYLLSVLRSSSCCFILVAKVFLTLLYEKSGKRLLFHTSFD